MCQLSSQCAFVRRSSRDLDLIFALQFERTVNRDNSVSIQNLSLQIESVRWRATLAGCSVTMHVFGIRRFAQFFTRLGECREIETRDRTSPKEKGRSYGAPQKPQS
jgi:hypothetical protein